jgi:LacI family transcriptional regulator
MTQAMGHLKELGHRDVGFIGGTEGLAPSRDCRDAFLAAVVKLGLSSQECWIVDSDCRMSGGDKGMEAILSHKEIPTAIVAADDLTAIGALCKAHERGLRVPEDLSVASCDDLAISDIVYPALTTLRVSRRRYAEMLFEALRWGMEHSSELGKAFSLPMTLVIRQSTGPAPKLNCRPMETKRNATAIERPC